MKLGFDIIFLALIAGSTIGCFFLGDERSQRFIVGSLVGVFAATQLASQLAKFGFLNTTYISFGLVVGLILVFVIPKRLRDKKWPTSRPKAAISGFLAAFFLLGYSISFLSDNIKTDLINNHNLAAMAYDLRFIALGILLIWLVVTLIIVGKAKH